MRDSPTHCGLHEFTGFGPCPRCVAETAKGGKPGPARAPVILNGERVKFEITTKRKPKWIPWWLWSKLCRLVIRNTQITAKSIPRE